MRLPATKTMGVATGMAGSLLLVLTACTGTEPASGQADRVDPAPAPQGSLVLDFESGPRVGQRVEAVTNQGAEEIDVVVADGGTARIESVEGPGGGLAVRYPAYTGEAAAPAAVLVAAAQSSGPLSPGERDFEFGATFELDPESSGSDADDGDNLLQRGSFSDAAQYKLQLDAGVPSCRVAGDAGAVFVEADRAVDPEVWYSVSCSRKGPEVVLTVTPYDARGDGESWRASGPTGTLTFGDQPLSVGGKVDPKGAPVASADQFNGAVDDVFLRTD